MCTRRQCTRNPVNAAYKPAITLIYVDSYSLCEVSKPLLRQILKIKLLNEEAVAYKKKAGNRRRICAIFPEAILDRKRRLGIYRFGENRS